MTTAERIAPASLFDGAATLAERLRRSVVAIGGRGGAGAGTVWRPGLIVTNHHVARAGSMRVETPDGDTLDGRVVARRGARPSTRPRRDSRAPGPSFPRSRPATRRASAPASCSSRWAIPGASAGASAPGSC